MRYDCPYIKSCVDCKITIPYGFCNTYNHNFRRDNKLKPNFRKPIRIEDYQGLDEDGLTDLIINKNNELGIGGGEEIRR